MKTDNSVNIRACALDIIMEVMENGAYSDKALHNVLDSGKISDKRDRSFLTRLCEGVIERAVELDYIIDCFSKVKVCRMKPVIRNIMRMAVYQIFYMKQVPDSAACNEAVKLAVKRKFASLRGFVNGVLRNVVREKENIKYPSYNEDFVKYASIKYSMPEWITKKYFEKYGRENTEKILKEYLNDSNVTTVRCNLSKADVYDIEEMLKSDGVNVEKGCFFEYALRITGYDRLSSLLAFKSGFIQVQDESSMLTSAIAGIKENYTVIDICAAPGGKTLHAADILCGTGKVISCDISQGKTNLIRDNIKRIGFDNIEVFENDALVYRDEWKEKADVVIADLPCSGLGVIGKKCDIKYKTKPEDLTNLAQLQREILMTAGRYVKPGGKLIYSTCTIASEENEENVRWIADNLPFVSVSIEDILPEKLKGKTGKNGYIEVLPYMAGTDGFFAAAFTKSADGK